MEHNDPTSTAHGENNSKRETHSNTGLPRQTRRFSTSLILTPEGPGERTPNEAHRAMKEWVTGTHINEVEASQPYQRSKQPRAASWQT